MGFTWRVAPLMAFPQVRVIKNVLCSLLCVYPLHFRFLSVVELLTQNCSIDVECPIYLLLLLVDK